MESEFSPAWIAAVRGDDGLMNTVDPHRWEPDDARALVSALRRILVAAFAEATAWGAEMDVTINPEPDPTTPLDFVTVDLDGRHPWHACNATFMAPSGRVDDATNGALLEAGWQGVGTGGPVYKMWDEVPLATVADDVAGAVAAVFPSDRHRYLELSVNVLAAEDDSGTSYDVVASATVPVIQRAVIAELGPAPEQVEWERACRSLGFDPGSAPPITRVPAP